MGGLPNRTGMPSRHPRILRDDHGGRNRARTCDPLVVIQVLCQLSYPPPQNHRHPIFNVCPSRDAGSWAHLDSNQGLTGYEPAALDR